MCWPKRKCWFGINTHIHVVIPPYNEHSKYPESPQCVFFCMCPAYRAGLWVGGWCGYPTRTHNSFIRAIHSQLAVTWLTRASGHLSTRSNAAETQIMAFKCISSCCTSRWHCTWRTIVIAIIFHCLPEYLIHLIRLPNCQELYIDPIILSIFRFDQLIEIPMKQHVWRSIRAH